MGVSVKTQSLLIHRELATFFLIPLVMPAIVVFLFIIGAQNMFGTFILQDNIIPVSGMITFGVFGVIYLVENFPYFSHFFPYIISIVTYQNRNNPIIRIVL